ncbi:hypothetical protein AEQ67_25150 [Pseudomonas sp. RIT-PI-q]|nr:hypothetical protein AEQ67_25150 [Pseudomonas sp. RIT-PI-q]
MRGLLGIAFVVALGGCSGKIINQAVAPDKCLTDQCEGILYYRQEVVTVTYVQDKILGKDNVLTHFAGAQDPKLKCEPMVVEERRMTSALKPSRIYYEPGVLETSKFSVSLTTNGNLAGVGADSTPGAKMAADVLASVVSSAAQLKDKKILKIPSKDGLNFDSGLPFCNAGQIPISETRDQRVPPAVPAPKPDPCSGPYIGDCK